jgi:hypothetical protein
MCALNSGELASRNGSFNFEGPPLQKLRIPDTRSGLDKELIGARAIADVVAITGQSRNRVETGRKDLGLVLRASKSQITSFVGKSS